MKPVFAVVGNFGLSKVEKEGKTFYKLASWPGEPKNLNPYLTTGFDTGDWNNYVYIDTTEESKTDIAKKIYSIKDFIHFKLSEEQVEELNKNERKNLKKGDYAILVGMHVTTKETKRWTWQTFWWSANPDAPHRPSSKTIAGLRSKANLDRAANHYAMGIAYSMLKPAQPYTGGSGQVPNATSLYTYNPYLEAGFNDSTFFAGNDIVKKYYKNDKDYQKIGKKLNLIGMQTNCMSCHIQARVPGVGPLPGTKKKIPFYLTDQYVDLQAPYFLQKGTVSLDFAWSIQGNLMNE